MDHPPRLAVIGAARCDPALAAIARRTGAEIARAGAVLLCGGGGGVMEAAASGAREAGGLTVGILPGAGIGDSPPNPHIQVAIYTGIGQARNQVLVLSGAAAIALGGGWGTLSEIGLALKHGVPVVCVESWRLERPDGRDEPLLLAAPDPASAVEAALAAARRCGRLPAPSEGGAI